MTYIFQILMDHHHFELLVKKGGDNVGVFVMVVAIVADWWLYCQTVHIPYHTILYHTIPYHTIHTIIYLPLIFPLTEHIKDCPTKIPGQVSLRRHRKASLGSYSVQHASRGRY